MRQTSTFKSLKAICYRISNQCDSIVGTMETRLLIRVAFFCVLVFVGTAFGQDVPKAVLVDDHGATNCCDLRGRMDLFFSELMRDPAARGLVVLSTKAENGVRTANRESMILTHAAFRGFPADRFDILRAVSGDDELRVRYWIIPQGAERPEVEGVEANYALPAAARPFMLTATYLDDGLCPGINDAEVFAKFMKDNPGARGNIVVRERTIARAAAEGRRVMRKFAELGVAGTRLRVFTETRRANEYNVPLVEYWFLP
jgi:hypothetical protein